MSKIIDGHKAVDRLSTQTRNARKWVIALSAGLFVMGVSGIIPDKLPIVSTEIKNANLFLLCYIFIALGLDAAFFFYSYPDYLKYRLSLPPDVEMPEGYEDLRGSLAQQIAEAMVKLDAIKKDYEVKYNADINQHRDSFDSLSKAQERGKPIAREDQAKLSLMREYFGLHASRDVLEEERRSVEEMHRQYWASLIDKWEPLRVAMDWYLPHVLLFVSMCIAAMRLRLLVLYLSVIGLSVAYYCIAGKRLWFRSLVWENPFRVPWRKQGGTP